MWKLFPILLLLAGCGGRSESQTWCPNPCLSNPDNLMLEPGWAESYEAARDKLEPGYHTKMEALRRDPGYQASMIRLDREIARADALRTQTRLEQDLDILRRQMSEPVIRYHR